MRTIALILLGCVAAGGTVLAGSLLWLGVWRGLAVGALAAAVVVVGYFAWIGPRLRRWGASDEEVARAMPGDVLLGRDAASTTRAIAIDAPPEAVFPWLLQIGFGRGGWYSYDWIDNDGRPSVDRIDPELQRLAVGDRIEMLPGVGPVVREIEPNRCIVSGGETDSWCLLVEPATDGTTRLISRWRQRWPRTPAARVWLAVVDPGAFVMERRMLVRIRKLAERWFRVVGVGYTAPGDGVRPTRTADPG